MLDETVAAEIATLRLSWSAHLRRRRKNAACQDRVCPAARKGSHMTIRFEKLKARLLANPRVKAEYDALAPEFEIAAELREGLRDKGGCSNGAG
jgi:hypothetical protein